MEHGFGIDVPRTLEEVCDPGRTALVVYDMQVGVLSQLQTAEIAIRSVGLVLSAAREGGYRVFFTRHTSLPPEVAGVSQLRMAMAWQRADRVDRIRASFPRDSPQTQIVPEVSPRASEAVFDKISMSCFVGTPMELALRDCGINSFIIAGVALEVGIDPTVRHGADLGFIPVVVEDACGGRDETARQRTLAGFRFAGDAIVTDTATIAPILRRTSKVPSQR